jgi:hypothetical protein
MNALMFECGHFIETGIEINYAILRKVQPVTARLFCPRLRGIDQEPPSLTPWSPCHGHL